MKEISLKEKYTEKVYMCMIMGTSMRVSFSMAKSMEKAFTLPSKIMRSIKENTRMMRETDMVYFKVRQ